MNTETETETEISPEHEARIMELSAVILDHATTLIGDKDGAVFRLDFALLAFAVLHAGNTLKAAVKEEDLWE